MICALRVEMVEEKGFSEEENAREGLSTNERDDWFLNFREVLGLQKKNSACFRSALALTALASEKANKKLLPYSTPPQPLLHLFFSPWPGDEVAGAAADASAPRRTSAPTKGRAAATTMPATSSVRRP
jgi:hypothetical protein